MINNAQNDSVSAYSNSPVKKHQHSRSFGNPQKEEFKTFDLRNRPSNNINNDLKTNNK